MAWGGSLLKDHSIPSVYGSWQPTAVFVPLEVLAVEYAPHADVLPEAKRLSCCWAWPWQEIVKPENFPLVTTEIFGPFQIVTSYNDKDLCLGQCSGSSRLPFQGLSSQLVLTLTDSGLGVAVLDALERMDNHLTAAVVSNDVLFRQQILASTINGTTYCGIRARTTGAPQNHWYVRALASLLPTKEDSAVSGRVIVADTRRLEREVT